LILGLLVFLVKAKIEAKIEVELRWKEGRQITNTNPRNISTLSSLSLDGRGVG
jgi:hypothetical protein